MKIIILFAFTLFLYCSKDPQFDNANLSKNVLGNIESIEYVDTQNNISKTQKAENFEKNTVLFVINGETIKATLNEENSGIDPYDDGQDNIYKYEKSYNVFFNTNLIDDSGNLVVVEEVSAIITVGILFDSDTGTISTSPTTHTTENGQEIALGNCYFYINYFDGDQLINSGDLFFQPEPSNTSFTENSFSAEYIGPAKVLEYNEEAGTDYYTGREVRVSINTNGNVLTK